MFVVAVDRSQVVFGTYGGEVTRIPKRGGTPVAIAPVPREMIVSIALDDRGVYVAQTAIERARQFARTGSHGCRLDFV